MPHKVTVNAGKTNVALPNGLTYRAGDVVVLTDEQFSKLSDTILATTLTDNGPYGSVVGNGAISVQATHVAAMGALTSSQNATAAAVDLPTSEALANALKANYNQLQTDVATLRTLVNAEIAALQVSGGPQASS